MRVPVQENFQVMPSANTGGRFAPLPVMPDAGKLAKETGAALNDVSRLFAYVQGEQNQTIVDDLSNQLVREANRLQFDPQSGALSLQGKNALDRPNGKSLNDEYGEKFQKFADDLIGADTDPLRRQALMRRASQIAAQLDSKLTQHVLQQDRVYKNETYTGRITTSAETAALNWGDKEALTESLKTAKDSIDRLAEINGWSADTKKARASAMLTGFHAGVIEAQIDAGQSKLAQQYYDAVKDDLTADGQNRLRDAIRKGGITRESMDLFDSVKGLGFGAARKKVEAMYKAGDISAEVRDATNTRLEHERSIRLSQQAEYDKQILGQAYDFVRNNPGKTYNDLPVGMQQTLSARGMNHTVDAWFKTGGNVRTDSALWASLMSDPSQLAGMTPLDIQKKWGSRLSESDLRTLYAYTEEGAKEKGSSEVLTTNEAIKAAGTRMGFLDPRASRNTPEMASSFYAFQEEVQRHIDDYKTVNKKSPSAQEIRKIISDIETNTVKNGIFFQTETPVFALTANQRKDAYVDVFGQQVRVSTIPAEVRAGLVSTLRQAGIYPSEKEIAQLWVDSGRPREVKRKK